MRSRFVSSEHNPEIKHVKALRDRRSIRRTERLCIVEGARFIHDLARIHRPVLVVVRESLGDDRVEEFDDVVIVPDSLFARISDTSTPQGMLAIFPWPDVPPIPEQQPLLIVADGIRDPGNLGTIIRSAAALGASKVVCGRGSTDPLSPKVVRAAAASQWMVPIVHSADFEPEETLAGLQVLIADGASQTRIDQIDLTVPCAVVIGNEAYGVSDAMRARSHLRVAIPMRATVESLNAGVAAGIILYEAQRQRLALSGC